VLDFDNMNNSVKMNKINEKIIKLWKEVGRKYSELAPSGLNIQEILKRVYGRDQCSGNREWRTWNLLAWTELFYNKDVYGRANRHRPLFLEDVKIQLHL